MDKENLIGLFTTGRAPEGKDNKEVLRQIVQSFPYFQMAQVLYARQMYIENAPDVTSRLKLASAYAPDRKAMYMLFRENLSPAETAAPLKTMPAAADEKHEDVKYNFVYTVKKEPVPYIPEEESIPMPARIQPEAKKVVPEKGRSKQPSSLSETFLEKEISAAAALVLTEKQIAANPTPETAIKSAGTKSGTAAESIPEKEPAFRSFSGWLQRMPMANVEIKITEPKKAVQEPHKSSDIIEQFLAKEPSISRPKAEFFSPSKAAKLSISDDDNPVSETLANIYMVQGNLPMALKAYQNLLLQNPGKKSYFAARIKEISNLLESGNAKK